MTSRLRVQQIFYGGMGGHATLAMSLLEATPQFDHAMTTFGIEPARDELRALCERRGASCDSVVKRRGLDWRALAEVRRSLEARRPDVILMHSLTTLFPVLWYARWLGASVVAIDHTAAEAKDPQDWAALALSMVLADRVVFLTPLFQDTVRRRLGPLFRAEKVRVIPNGIDTERFVPAHRGTEARPLTACMLSRFTPVRDHATLVRAIEQVFAQRPMLRKEWRFILAGEGNTLADTRELVERLALGDVVVLPGSLELTGVLELLQRSAFAIQASMADNMSTAVMQAMACGLAVVATRVPGMEFLVSDERTGLLVPPSDERALAATLIRLMESAETRQRLGAAGRQDAIARLSAHRMAGAYAELVFELRHDH